MANSQEKTSHGGARPGAGRRAKDLVRINASLSRLGAGRLNELRTELAWEGDDENNERSRTEIIEMGLLVLAMLVKKDEKFKSGLVEAPTWFKDGRLPAAKFVDACVEKLVKKRGS